MSVPVDESGRATGPCTEPKQGHQADLSCQDRQTGTAPIDPETGKPIKKEKTKYHLDTVDFTASADELVHLICQRLDSFKAHKERVRQQQEAVSVLKNNMPVGTHATVQIDYAENWNSAYMREVAGHHWKRKGVTIHPMVVHVRMRNENDEISLHSLAFAGISPYLKHSFPTTMTFLDELIKKLLDLFPDLKYLHIISDSPSSQYRNLYSCAWLRQAEDRYGLQITWNWLEAGHGKVC